MILTTALLAALPLLSSASPIARVETINTRIQSAALPDLCLAVFTAVQPKAGDRIQLNKCSGPAYRATMTFETPDIGGMGLIRYSPTLCFTAGDDPANGDAVVLGNCEDATEWKFDSDGTIRAAGENADGNGICANIAKEDNGVQVWECNPYDEQGSEYLSTPLYQASSV